MRMTFGPPEALLMGAAILYVASLTVALAGGRSVSIEPVTIAVYIGFAILMIGLGILGERMSRGMVAWGFATSLSTILTVVGFLYFFWAPLVLIASAMVPLSLLASRVRRGPSSGVLPRRMS